MICNYQCSNWQLNDSPFFFEDLVSRCTFCTSSALRKRLFELHPGQPHNAFIDCITVNRIESKKRAGFRQGSLLSVSLTICFESVMTYSCRILVVLLSLVTSLNGNFFHCGISSACRESFSSLLLTFSSYRSSVSSP